MPFMALGRRRRNNGEGVTVELAQVVVLIVVRSMYLVVH
jgi:hypothetical protein